MTGMMKRRGVGSAIGARPPAEADLPETDFSCILFDDVIVRIVLMGASMSR